MRFLSILAVIFGLTACQTTTNSPTQSSPLLDAAVDSIVANANAERGEPIGLQLINDGATRVGNRAVVTFKVRPELTETLRSLPRGEVQGYMRRIYRQQSCSEPNFRTFIGLGGAVESVWVDAVGRTLASAVVDRC